MAISQADIASSGFRVAVSLALVSFLTAYSQQANNDVQFEVASVKLADRPGPRDRRTCSGGPQTSNPGTWSCGHITLGQLIYTAYNLRLYQFKSPDWMESTWFAVNAKVPAGTSKEQLRGMQQKLLEERFKLTFHREPKEVTVYDLVVEKDGPRMQESAPDAPPAEVEPSVILGYTTDQDHFPVFPPGTNALMGMNGHLRWKSPNVTMVDVVNMLRREMQTDVIDRTGLTGRYDVDLHWQQRPIEYFPDALPFHGPAIEKAIQDRLGLKLEARKGTVSRFVVDHIEKTPVEN
jgi:uncharacterized protein (TIGR03435 family)